LTIVAVCLDGVSWSYIEEADTSFLDSLTRVGSSTTAEAMVPTVTNVNQASILTASHPDIHGISGNTYYNPASRRMVYMDSSHFLRCPTLLETTSKRGWRTLLLTVKDKLRRLLSKGVTHSYSIERPTDEVVRELGSPPSIYTAEADLWLLRAARWELEHRRWDLVYLSTTDYIAHKHGPGEPEAKEYLSRLDETLEELWGLGMELGVVSDHGMEEKRVNLDPVRLLREKDIEARLIAAIRDEHYVHHRNLGGSAYLYVEEDVERARRILSEAEGVELTLTREEAVERFRLPPDRIGDLLLLAEEDYTLGPNPRSIYRDVELRSHGSLHEVEIPLILSLHKPLEGVENRMLLTLLGIEADVL
jgi:phosphonoacetate hydrolase